MPDAKTNLTIDELIEACNAMPPGATPQTDRITATVSALVAEVAMTAHRMLDAETEAYVAAFMVSVNSHRPRLSTILAAFGLIMIREFPRIMGQTTAREAAAVLSYMLADYVEFTEPNLPPKPEPEVA